MTSQLRNTPSKRNLVFYFQVHQPKRLNDVRFFDIGAGNDYFDNDLNRKLLERIATTCYLPTNALLLRMIKKHPEIKVCFSVSGTLLEQMEAYTPEVIDSFRALIHTGNVEILAETYYHSLACMVPGKEWEAQVLKHVDKIYEHFGVRPSVFRNTELLYNDELGERISRLGFAGTITDGLERVLGDQSPNHVFANPKCSDLKLLLRNYTLSDDIAFRFDDDKAALTAAAYLAKVERTSRTGETITLAMDYETFGEHKKRETGIFSFLEDLLTALANHDEFVMKTPAESMEVDTARMLSIPQMISWADQERDLSAWLGNEMQRDAFDTALKLEFDIKNLNEPELLETWRNLLTSDHFYYMSTKKGTDGTIHNYFSPYSSPYEAFINYMNILTDFSMQVKVLQAKQLYDTRNAVQEAINQSKQVVGSRMTLASY